MRLLNTATRRLQEFYGSNIPVYAILSHRWGNEEVTFQDLMSRAGAGKAGWAKIEGCCRQAALDDFQWVWIDSCCIDKSSSSELSEAINSMFRWYLGSKVCYAYLSDVATIQGTEWVDYSGFRDSLWFTRGWTLQELLAPRHVVFYDQDWAEVGTKMSLEGHIASSTGIRDITQYEQASVAQKMSWASKRKTTREEDTAYCLMGLFGVNMPALYGEGQNAFLRLQLQILQHSDDESIFAWQWPGDLSGGLLAPYPSAFEDSGDIERALFDKSRAPYSITNKGLRMELSIIAKDAVANQFRSRNYTSMDATQFLAPLNCMRTEDIRKMKPYPLAICLQQMGRDQFIRVSYGELLPTLWTADRSRKFVQRTLYIKQDGSFQSLSSGPRPPVPYTFFFIKLTPNNDHGFSLEKQFFIKNKEIFLLSYGVYIKLGKGSWTGGALFSDSKSETFVVVVDISKGQPGLHIRTAISSKLIQIWPDPTRDAIPSKAVDNVKAFNNGTWQNKSLEDMMQGPSSVRCIDRLSVPLSFRKSVSAVLKPSGLRGVDYSLEVTIDPSGGLRWPI